MYNSPCVFCGKEWPKDKNGKNLKWPALGTQWTTYQGYPIRSNRNLVPELKFWGRACTRCNGIIGTHFGTISPDHPEYTEAEYKKLAVQYHIRKR